MDVFLLNNQQQEAVENLNQHILVIAGPGTGKTNVIVAKVLYAIKKGVSADDIFVFAYNKEIKKELSQKLKKFLGNNLPSIHTFHSFCLKLLKNTSESFDIVSKDQQELFLNRCIEVIASKDFPKDKFRKLIKRFKGDIRSLPHDMLRENYEMIIDVMKEYINKLKTLDLISFDGIISGALNLLEKLEVNFSYPKMILVDEAQDQNIHQYNLIRLLTKETTIVTFVGDDDQSIYSFREALRYILEQFLDDYRAKVITFTENYRNPPEILELALNIVSHGNTKRFPKKLRANNSFSSKPQLHVTDTLDKEVKYLLNKINEMVKQGYKYKDISILTRNHKRIEKIVVSLDVIGIPYSYPKMKKIEDSSGFKTLYSLVSYLGNPSKPQIIKEILISLFEEKGKRLFDVLLKKEETIFTYDSFFGIDEEREKFRSFQEFLSELDSLIKEGEVNMVIPLLLNRICILKDLTLNVDEFIEDLKIVEKMLSLQNSMNPEISTLESIYSIMRLKEKRLEFNKNGIQIFSIHSSKGLEFPIVFLIGMENGIFPMYQQGADPFEQRRLAYVAMTRAQKYLIMTAHVKSKKSISPYLLENYNLLDVSCS